MMMIMIIIITVIIITDTISEMLRLVVFLWYGGRKIPLRLFNFWDNTNPDSPLNNIDINIVR
jgi:hypothetical protein